MAANMAVSSFAIGVLGKSTFDLAFVDAFLVILFFNFLGVMTVCFFSTFGPAFGLRQMVLSRFWFGWYAVKFSMYIHFIDLHHTFFHVNIHFLQSLFSTSSPA